MSLALVSPDALGEAMDIAAPYIGRAISSAWNNRENIARIARNQTKWIIPRGIRAQPRSATINMARSGRTRPTRTMSRARGAKYQKFQAPRMEVGENSNSNLAKKDLTLFGATVSQDSRTLYTVDLTNIPKGTNINERNRHIANVRGFGVNWQIKNVVTSPMMLNIAVISRKKGYNITPTNFFRDYAQSRDVDFGTALTSNQMHTLPISTDLYSILKHKRIVIAGQDTSATTSGIKNWHVGKVYVKLNRQIRYDDDIAPGTASAEDRVYLVYWWDHLNEPAAAGVDANSASIAMKAVTYYDDAVRSY